MEKDSGNKKIINSDEKNDVIKGSITKTVDSKTVDSKKTNTNEKISKNRVEAKESLLPIKGIDDKRKTYLNQIGIFTISDLLQQGATDNQRKNIASKLIKLEIGNITSKKDIEKWEKIFNKYVNSWVKQADLWSVEGMDPDTAYFLVELGIRHVEDLAKVEPNKAYPIMKCLENSQPNFSLISLEGLTTLIKNAKNRTTKYLKYQDKLDSKLQWVLKEIQVPSSNIKSLRKVFSKINIEDIIGGNLLEIDEPAPTFLFKDEINNKLISDTNNSGKVIEKGLGFLKDVELTLPLPKIIQGTIYMVKSGEKLPEDKKERKNYAFYDGLVEISGISSSSEDKSEDYKNPHGYTDSNGNFIIVMPNKYNMQEAITIIISKGINKQKFILSANDIINHVDKQEILIAFKELEVVCSDLQIEEEKLDFIKNIENQKKIQQKVVSESEEKRFNELFPKKDLIASEIELLKENKASLEKKIRNSDNSTNDLERIYRNLFYCDNLVSDFREEPFILNEKIFNGYKYSKKKVLPSVKLMGNENEAIYLPTDTAPSRIFNYSMVQRLVEPAISPLADIKNSIARIPMTNRVDVMDFKERISTEPEKWPQMSSLGIGYVLNMHQAWVPDGFALGNLLYSLILAPGEEQRLVVREKLQSYKVTDKSEGNDFTSENYENSQIDNTTAAYEYALNQMMQGSSNSSYSTRSSTFGGSGGLSGGVGGFGAMFGLSGSKSTSSGKAFSSSSQTNSHNEASSATQRFQHGIKTASERIAQAQRLSISMATGEEKDSVATRIIANHNHSHAMTIQYWEVMRRYSLETCIDSVDLVLFVPIKLIDFLNGEKYILDSNEMNRDKFNKRYEILLKYADAIETSLPSKYSAGLELINKYAAYPNWIMENGKSSVRFINLEFKGSFLYFDDITAILFLKNGKGRIAGTVKYSTERYTLKNTHETTNDLKEEIKRLRNKTEGLITCTVTFIIPANITDDDLSYIRIDYSCDEVKYVLYKNPSALGFNNTNAEEVYEKMIDKMWDLAKDRKNSSTDRTKIEYYKEMLPEAWLFPNVTISPNELKRLGVPVISDVKIYKNKEMTISANSDKEVEAKNDNVLAGMLSSSILSSSISIAISSSSVTLRYSELQEMEATLHHIVSNTTKYSQVVWATLTSDERALLLEQYTIDMNFRDSDYVGKFINNTSDEPLDISLLNCINVKNLLGFYGNCMLFPFTYPQELADKIGKTAGELQDSLYKYHTNYFRVPSTTISLPTEGMIGEAVLGETNVSEEIDLTRFWNWQDSPIDNMPIDSSYLNNEDYLLGKTTKDISPLNIQGATTTTHVTAADLVSALISKQTPTFDNITGLDQLKDILKTATNSTTEGRNAAITSSSDMAKAAMEYAYKTQELETKNEENKLKDKLAKLEEELNKIRGDYSHKDSDLENDHKDEINNGEDSSKEIEDDIFLDNKSNINIDKLKEVLTKALEAKANGLNFVEFFQGLSGRDMTEEEIMKIAEKFCLENGIHFNDSKIGN